MSIILVIPDTHLKPKIFDLTDKIMREYEVDYAVQLGDNFDDFYCLNQNTRRIMPEWNNSPKTAILFHKFLTAQLLIKLRP